jgi:2-polyprenyl-3-methyl-5-hydroxy-6-metoxy-1,4-benzoquinol methylase
MLENTGFKIVSLDGVLYNPFNHNMRLSSCDGINYIVFARKVNKV